MTDSQIIALFWERNEDAIRQTHAVYGRKLYNCNTIAHNVQYIQEAMVMNDILRAMDSPLFSGIKPEDQSAMLSCIGYHISAFRKGDIVAFEEENH